MRCDLCKRVLAPGDLVYSIELGVVVSTRKKLIRWVQTPHGGAATCESCMDVTRFLQRGGKESGVQTRTK